MHSMRFDQTNMPGMEYGPKPELHARHDICVKPRCRAWNLANFMPGMKSSPANFSAVRDEPSFFHALEMRV